MMRGYRLIYCTKWIFGSLLLSSLLLSCGKVDRYHFNSGRIFGTIYHITYEYKEDLQKEIEEELQKVDASLSMFNPESVISKINSNQDSRVDSLFHEVFLKAKEVHKRTEGAFDITVAPLVNAWGFGSKKMELPTDREIDSLMSFVGMDKVDIENGEIIKELEGIELDASAIAKGFGVDRVAKFLDSKGVNNYMIEVGGEVRVKGESNKARPWRIGINRPRDEENPGAEAYQFIVLMESGALATSGNYLNFYKKDGKRYVHTMDPKSGRPVQRDILSASVYAPSCTTADAYATAFMVLGLEESRRIVESDLELEACFIYITTLGDREVWISEGLRKMIDNR